MAVAGLFCIAGIVAAIALLADLGSNNQGPAQAAGSTSILTLRVVQIVGVREYTNRFGINWPGALQLPINFTRVDSHIVNPPGWGDTESGGQAWFPGSIDFTATFTVMAPIGFRWETGNAQFWMHSIRWSSASADSWTPVTPSFDIHMGSRTLVVDPNAPAIPTAATATFNLHGGNISGETSISQQFIAGGFVTQPRDPVRAGFAFLGWYGAANGGGGTFNFMATQAGDVTIHAHWTPARWTVSFNSMGGIPNNIVHQDMNHNSTVTAPSPTRAGFIFLRWQNAVYGGSPHTLSAGEALTITQNMSFVAVWNMELVNLTLNIHSPWDDTRAQIVMPVVVGTVINLGNHTITHPNFAHIGWATSAANAAAHNPNHGGVNSTITAHTATTLWAVWSANATITPPPVQGHSMVVLNYSGGRNEVPITTHYTTTRFYQTWYPPSLWLPTVAEMNAFAQNPSNSGFNGLRFEGWYTNPELMGQRFTAIPANAIGVQAFYARWVQT